MQYLHLPLHQQVNILNRGLPDLNVHYNAPAFITTGSWKASCLAVNIQGNLLHLHKKHRSHNGGQILGKFLINAAQHIAAADKQPQRERNGRQMIHIRQQIRKAADHGHLVTFHKSHERTNIGLVLVDGDSQSRTVQQAGEHLLHKDVKGADRVLQHDIAGTGMKLIGKGPDILTDTAVHDTYALGTPGGV